MARFVLLHSPLVGPLTLSPLAAALNRLGHSAVVPDLGGAVSPSGLSTSDLTAVVTQSVSDLGQPGPLIVAAHSGASAYLPCLSTALDFAGQVLIDAIVPPEAGPYTPSGDFRSELDRLVAADGRLPPWPQWWGEEVMAQLVPDPDLRAAISGECPRLPMTFYDTVIEVPSDWADPWTGYLRLSESYEQAAVVAARRGWPVRRRVGTHLDTATRPDEVALDVLDLIAPLLDGPIPVMLRP